MRVLIVGAGGIGGYFGGRLLEAGREVTFLVRAGRAERLARTGLVITSRFGDVTLQAPPTILAPDLREPYDLVLVSCKGYDLEGAMADSAPAVGPDTAILPLLNGMRHFDRLDQRFGAGRVLGGLCMISAALDAEGRVVHNNDFHGLVFGERDGSRSARAEAVASVLDGARFDARLSEAIVQEMWEKWLFIATSAGINCLMRATVGDVVAAGAAGLAVALLEECAAIAARQGHPPRPAWLEWVRAACTAPGSLLATSMLRDIERGAPVEAEAIIGDLLARGGDQPGAYPVLGVVHAHLKSYEARRKRESGA